VNAVSFDPSWERTVDEIAAIVAMGAEYGATVVVESCPLLTIATLAQAMELIEIVSTPNFKLLIDTMHVTRSGEAATLANIDPNLIDYVQISDGPLTAPSMEAYMDEAMDERRVPGEGEMPLVKMLQAIRPDVVVSGEVPMRSLREAGVSDLDRSRRVVAGMRRVLETADREQKT
jgi:sugar phosphate isomerase/epimerase